MADSRAAITQLGPFSSEDYSVGSCMVAKPLGSNGGSVLTCALKKNLSSEPNDRSDDIDAF